MDLTFRTDPPSRGAYSNQQLGRRGVVTLQVGTNLLQEPKNTTSSEPPIAPAPGFSVGEDRARSNHFSSAPQTGVIQCRWPRDV